MENGRWVSRIKPRSAIGRAFLKGGILLFAGLLFFGGYFYYAPIFPPGKYAPQQPYEYSHKLHAGDLGINCQYCHIYAKKAEFAGVPPFSKCMNCHVNLSINKPSVKAIQKAYEEKNMGRWTRVYNLPDHVWFSHKRHVSKNIDCAACHGPVETLVVSTENRVFRMGFCVRCHQERGASTDCWACHT